MQIHEEVPFSLPRYATNLVRDAVQQSGSPFVVVERPDVPYDYSTMFAHRSQPYHFVFYNPNCREHQLHFAVNSAIMVLRRCEARPADRLVPISEEHQRLSLRDEQELRSKLVIGDRAEFNEFVEMLFDGIVHHLAGVPTDLRIGRSIADLLPEHLERQAAYMKHQIDDLSVHFQPEIRATLPKRMYRAATALNYAFAVEAASICGIEPPGWTNRQECQEQGERVRQAIISVDEPGCRGDRIAIDRCAAILNLEDTYSWTCFDERD